MATDSAVTCNTYTKNDCPKVSASGMKNCGRCQQAQRSPSRTLARARPKRVAKRGSAYPRQPISSPAWKGVENATANRDEVPRLAAEARPRACGHALDERRRELDGGDVADGEQVPSRRHSPLEYATEQRAHARASLGPRREPERDQ